MMREHLATDLHIRHVEGDQVREQHPHEFDLPSQHAHGRAMVINFYSRQSLGMHTAMPSVSMIKARPFTSSAR